MLSMLCVAAFCRNARADDPKSRAFDPTSENWEGLAELVRLAGEELGPQRVVVTSVLPLGQLEQDDALLLVHPTRALDVDELAAFMRAGGRVILLDDYGTGDELLSRFHVLRVPMPERPARMLRGNPSFAIAEPASDHPVLVGLAGLVGQAGGGLRDAPPVVTNHATGLEQPALQRLLVVRGDGEPDVTLAVAGVVGRGRFVAVGDASLLINSMLRFPGNGTLAVGLVRYAAGTLSPSERHGKLYLLTNDFDTTGSFGDDSTLGGAVGNARRALSGALETLQHDGMPAPAMLVLAVVVTLGLIAWTMANAGRTYRPTVLRFVRPIPVSMQGGAAGRAAALGRPNGPRGEAVLEMRRALEEALAARISIEGGPPAARLVEGVRQSGLLGPDDLEELRRLLGELRQMEAALAHEAPRRAWRLTRRVRLREITGVSKRVQGLFRALSKGGDSAPSGRRGAA